MKALFLMAWVAALPISGYAQTSTTSVNSSTTSTTEVLGNKKFAEDKDITDSKIKADSGSLSKYSLKFSLSYMGPPMGNLESSKQPNIDGSIGNYSTALSGSMSGRYRFDSKSTMSLGTGLKVIAPFHGAERTDISTPFVSYDRSSRLGEVQTRNSVGASLVTTPEYRDVGQVATLNLDGSLVYNFGTSGLAVGLDYGPSLFLYEREYENSDRTASRYYIGLYPQIKYNFSDKLNAYTSLAFAYQNLRAVENEFQLQNRTVSGRVGLGWAFTRTVYFAPYLSFYPDQLKTENTTISFSTVFSIL
jgi:hypothetical protein